MLLALTTWVAALAWAWAARSRPTVAALAPWQRSYLELSPDGQRRYRAVREGILEAENVRAATKAWPDPSQLKAEGVPPFDDESYTWVLRQHGIYVNYVGVRRDGPAEARWLLLFIEPEKSAFDAKAPPPPVDEEHHTLPDGTALHVTVWTTGGASASNEAAPFADEVLAFPVSEGWVQRVGR